MWLVFQMNYSRLGVNVCIFVGEFSKQKGSYNRCSSQDTVITNASHPMRYYVFSVLSPIPEFMFLDESAEQKVNPSLW